jgi:hypothetical protein
MRFQAEQFARMAGVLQEEERPWQEGTPSRGRLEELSETAARARWRTEETALAVASAVVLGLLLFESGWNSCSGGLSSGFLQERSGGRVRSQRLDEARDQAGSFEASGEPAVNLLREIRPWMGVTVLAVASQAVGQQAVEWKVSEGGNGHWYCTITRPEGFTRPQAQNHSASLGGHLFTGCGAEFSTAISLANALSPSFWAGNPAGGSHRIGPWIGLAWSSVGTWYWIDGSDCVFDGWDFADHQPDNAGEDSVLLYSRSSTPASVCHDIRGSIVSPSYILEYDTDCNADGIVDYGQILSGELIDANANGVPDCCETGEPCTATNLLLNGRFEAGTPLAACASESATAPNTLAPGWQVSAGTVDRIHGGSTCTTITQPKIGDYCIDLCGTPASSGAIRQVAATIPGHRYRCVFWLSGDASAGPAAKKVHAKVGTYVDLSYTFTCSGTGAQAWVSNQFEFTARGANETLEFVADNGLTTGGPMLDAISLVDITTQCVGDLDASGEVDGADIALLLLNFGPCSTTP